MNEGDVIVAVKEDGSWRHPNQFLAVYVCSRDGIYYSRLPWSTESDCVIAIHAVAELLQQIHEGWLPEGAEDDETTLTTLEGGEVQ